MTEKTIEEIDMAHQHLLEIVPKGSSCFVCFKKGQIAGEKDMIAKIEKLLPKWWEEWSIEVLNDPDADDIGIFIEAKLNSLKHKETGE